MQMFETCKPPTDQTPSQVSKEQTETTEAKNNSVPCFLRYLL